MCQSAVLYRPWDLHKLLARNGTIKTDRGASNSYRIKNTDGHTPGQYYFWERSKLLGQRSCNINSKSSVLKVTQGCLTIVLERTTAVLNNTALITLHNVQLLKELCCWNIVQLLYTNIHTPSRTGWNRKGKVHPRSHHYHYHHHPSLLQRGFITHSAVYKNLKYPEIYTSIANHGVSSLKPFTLKFHFSSLPISFCFIYSSYQRQRIQTCWERDLLPSSSSQVVKVLEYTTTLLRNVDTVQHPRRIASSVPL
jgi:hypothetical protein